MSCEGKKKGKVFFTDKGVKQQIIIPTAPFFVTCSSTGSCGRSGTRTITVNVANPAASANNGSQYSSASFQDEIFFFKAVSQSGTYDGNRYDLWGNCHGTNRLILAGFSIMSGAVTITNDIFVSNGTDGGLVVTNAMGNAIIRVPVSECNFTISCDANCPEGFCECKTDGFPGYCCLDCGATAASIRSITNELKGKNG